METIIIEMRKGLDSRHYVDGVELIPGNRYEVDKALGLRMIQDGCADPVVSKTAPMEAK